MGNARIQPLVSLEILLRHGSDAGARAPDFPFFVRKRLRRASIADAMVHRGIFGDDSVGTDRFVRRLLRAAIQGDVPTWELCRPDDGQSLLSGDLSNIGIFGRATRPERTRTHAAGSGDPVL